MTVCDLNKRTSPLKATVPGKDTVCALVVTYFPNADLLSRLQRIRPQVAHLVIVDNGSSGESANYLLQIEMQADTHIIRNSDNLGIATALNQGARWAESLGYDWLLAFDQDTVVSDDIVAALSECYQHFPAKEKLAVIASNYIDVMSGYQLLRPIGDESTWEDVPMAITSGSLFSLSVFHAVGPFRDEFFIDSVDFEYCLRALSRGYKVIVARKAFTHHPIGAATMHKLPWRNKTLLTTNHSPLRRYYMVRNQLVLAREYLGSQTAPTALMLYRHLKAFTLMVLFEKEVWPKLKFMAIGAWDGLFSNFNRKLT